MVAWHSLQLVPARQTAGYVPPLPLAPQVGPTGSPNARSYLSHQEEQAHFALWALLKSPLFVAANLRQLSPVTLAILKTHEVIAVNQDELGVPGDLVWKAGPKEARNMELLSTSRVGPWTVPFGACHSQFEAEASSGAAVPSAGVCRAPGRRRPGGGAAQQAQRAVAGTWRCRPASCLDLLSAASAVLPLGSAAA